MVFAAKALECRPSRIEPKRSTGAKRRMMKLPTLVKSSPDGNRSRKSGVLLVGHALRPAEVNMSPGGSGPLFNFQMAAGDPAARAVVVKAAGGSSSPPHLSMRILMRREIGGV